MANPTLLATIGWQELLLILVIVVLIFGGSRLPQVGKGLGEFVRNLKSGLRGDEGKKPAGDDKEDSGR
jgi:sec-independent protein translocase protein TatA